MMNYRHLQVGEKNPNWRGGRVLASNGYVLIRVGIGHPLADCRGYAYEHRLVASEIEGRWIHPSEPVHHKDRDRTNNEPRNLEVKPSAAHHRVDHRKSESPLRLPGEANPIVGCACGCGGTFGRFDAQGRPRRFISGHNPIPQPEAQRILDILKQSPMTAAELAAKLQKKRSTVSALLSRLKRDGIVYQAGGRKWRLLEEVSNER